MYLPPSADRKYDRVSSVVQECQGRMLPCYFWTCDDGVQKILVSGICNTKIDCSDRSDEKEELCEGFTIKFVITVALAVGVYALIGALLYFGIACFHGSEDTQEPPGRDQEIELNTPYTDSVRDLVGLLQGPGGPEISGELDKRLLKEVYEVHKSHGMINLLIGFLRYAETPNVDRRNSVVDSIFRLEQESLKTEEDHSREETEEGEGNAFEELRNLCQDDKLFGWMVGILQRGAVYKVKEFFRTKLMEIKSKVPFFQGEDAEESAQRKRLLKKISLCLTGVRKLFSFYFDLFKDILGYFILDHIASEILQHNFDEIGGINLDYIKYAMLFSAVAGQVSIYTMSFIRLSRGCVKSKLDLFTLAFPIHSILLKQGQLNFKEFLIEEELKDMLEKLCLTEAADRESGLLKSYSTNVGKLLQLRQDMSKTRGEYCKVQLFESILELMPQLVYQLVLFQAGKQYLRIRRLFEEFGEEDEEASWFSLTTDQAFYLAMGSSVVGIVNSLRHWKNKARYPLGPSFLGTVLQMVSISALVLPKFFLIATCLKYVPVLYLATLLIEGCILAGYWKLVLKEPVTMEMLPSLICPAFLSHRKGRATRQEGTEILSSTFWSGLPSTIVLSLLTLMTVYLPTGLVLHLKLYAIYEPGGLSDVTFAICAYFIGLLVYVITTPLYYFAGHNWKMEIQMVFRQNYTRMLNKQL